MSLQFQTVILAAGASLAIQTRGKVFVCDSATDNFNIRADNSAEITMAAKRVFGSSTSPEFGRITIRNTSVATNTITFAITLQDVKIEQAVSSVIATITVAAQKNAPTTVSGSGIIALGSGSSTAAITNTGGKQFAVRNHATSVGTLQIKDGSGNIMDVLAPGDPPWTLETSGTFILTASGGACDYSWNKVIYL